jgi:hypothetical protein
MIFVKIFFTALVCCYDNFCQSCCHQCCKKKDNTEELLNSEDLFDCKKSDKIIPDSYSNNKQTEESIDDIQYENREQNFDYIREKRIQNVSDGLLSGDYNKAEEIIQNFDSKIKQTEESIDKKNPYIQYEDEDDALYFSKLMDQYQEDTGPLAEDQKPDTDNKQNKVTASIKEIIPKQAGNGTFVYFRPTNEESWYNYLNPKITTFEIIKTSFLKVLEQKNSTIFYWKPNDVVTDSGGPSRQLLSEFYQNLLEREAGKLPKKNAENMDYIVFGSYMNHDDAMMLGKLAFLSLTKKSSMEYNLPEVYYKIMLHDEKENLEDYLTLADFKTMIGIMKETKDGKTVVGRYLIPVDIKINPNKDRVFLKYAKEEVYKIYLRLYQEDDVKDFEAFKDNFEEEIAELMFERLGIKIKEVLNGFIDGYQIYLNKILNYLSEDGFRQLLKDIKPFKRIEDINTTAKNTEKRLLSLRQCLQENEFRPKDLKIYIEGEPVASVEDLMNHFEVGYDNKGFTEYDIADIVKKKIQGSDKRLQKKFFEQLSFLLTGSRIFTGKVKVYIEDINGSLKISTCGKILYLSAKNPKEAFEEVLEASNHVEDYTFNAQ